MLKALFFLFFILIGPLQAEIKDSYSLVFCYLGENLPGYIRQTIAQARLFNENANVFLIVNEGSLEKNRTLAHTLKNLDVTIVRYEELAQTKEHEEFKKECIRHGFNSYLKHTTERFFCIDELMHLYGLKDVFQIECDVMTYVNLENYLPLMHAYYPGIAAPFESDHIASVSFVYFANSHAIRDFTKFIPQKLKGQVPEVDMFLLASYKNSRTDQHIDYLPTVSKEQIRSHFFVSIRGDRSAHPWKYWNYIEEWDSIFDCDWIGQYLVEGVWEGTQVYFNPDLYYITWERDGQGRKIPYAYFRSSDSKYRINTLHVFSKKFEGCMSIGGIDLPSRGTK